MPFIAAAGAVAGLASSAIGAMSASADRNAAKAASEAAVKEIRDIGAPPNQAAAIYIAKLEQAGVLTPEMEKEINLQMSKVAAITEDPRFKDTQLEVLDQMSEVTRRGLTAEDRQDFNVMREKINQENESKRQQLLAMYQQRGLAGSGSEIASQLLNAQGGANLLAQGGDEIAAAAAQKKAASMAALGDYVGQLRGQDFDIEKTKAGAEDVVNQFNTAQSINREQRRAQSTNAINAANLAEEQRVQDTNTMMDNQEKQRQLAAERTNYLDRADQAGRVASAQLGKAADSRASAKETAQNWQNIGSGLGGAAGSYMNYDAAMKGAPKTPPAPVKAKFAGGRIDGPEVVPGDSPLNDIIDAKLSSGEYVVPKEDAPTMELLHRILKGMKKG